MSEPVQDDIGNSNSSSKDSENGSGGKVSLGLIETILGQMKCEFNKSTIIDDDLKKDKECKAVVDEAGDLKNESLEVEGGGQVSVTECEENSKSVTSRSVVEEEEEECSSVTGLRLLEESCDKVEGGVTTEAKVSSGDEIALAKVEEIAPNISTAIEASEEMLETSTVTKVNKELVVSTDDTSTPVKVETLVSDTQEIKKETGKRSLRSQNAAKTFVEIATEPAGVKRSARRRSKDSPRESVLQSAIARKEKSFSNITNSDDKNSSSRNLKMAAGRAQRVSPAEKSYPVGSKAKVVVKGKVQTVKAPKLSSQVDIILSEAKSSLKVENLATEESRSKPIKVREGSEFVTKTDGTENTKINVEPNVRLSTRSQTPSNTPQNYTKTGKRRYKPFKGLRYSFTGGHKKTKIVRRRDRSLSASSRPSSAQEKITPTKSDVSVKSEDSEIVAGEGEEIQEESSMQVSSSPEVIGNTLPVQVTEIEVDVAGRSTSPEVAEACQSVVQKRRLQPDEEENELEEDGKRSRHSQLPSPSPAEDSPGPSKPESTAIATRETAPCPQVGPASLCLCQHRSQLYVTGTGTTGELYCQAFDSLDSRIIGCGNVLGVQDVRMYRPSGTVPYLILCEVHLARMLRHNCCPGCGIFCTQGKFVQCPSLHLYHRECQLMVDEKSMCPHCGLDSPLFNSFLTLGAHKNPVFLPQQKPPKLIPSAKMSFCNVQLRSTEDVVSRPPSPPLLPSFTLTLPSGREVSSEGLPSALDKDKLARMLCVASGMRAACDLPGALVRYSLKSMYQAAKMGKAEKLLAILASGLNPNHLFRECLMGSALHAACSGGHLVTVHVLLQAGAQLDVMDREQNTPLMLAAVEKHNDVVKYLIKAGACVTLKGADGMTALHMAAKAGNMEACHYLLSVPNIHSSYIDNVDDGGWTPLVWAAEHCHTDVARLLLEKRADPLICDAEQNVALHWSAFSGSIDISEMLLNYGCQINCANAHGDTPLHIAARQNAYNCVLLLLARGARVDLSNKRGDCALNCCMARSGECHTAIRLNMEMQALMSRPRNPAPRILTNDVSHGKEVNPIQCVNAEDEEVEPKDYVYVSENCFTSSILVDRTITSLQSCACRDTCCSTVTCVCANISFQCWYDEEGRLLPEFNYADPPMLFECNQACACNRVTCKNRVVQHGLTSRFELFRTVGKGWGVRTLRPIRKGSYVCEYIGEIISDCEADHREDDSYLFDLDNRDGETYCIDARHYGNIARFINHMCTPNLLSVRVYIDHHDLHFPRIALFANRDIEAEEELGFDYGEKFWIIKCKSFTCTCGSPSCRYSDVTIQQTLENYKRRLAEDAQ